MDPGDKAAPVTRREFNNALVLVWTFIMLAFSTTVFRSSRGAVAAPNVIYLGVSLVMVASYAVASFRSDLSRNRVLLAVYLAAVALAVGALAFLAGRISN
jgi:hypothetical protein